MPAWNQGGIIISIYDIPLLHFLFCKTVSLKEWVAAIENSFTIEEGQFIEWMATTGLAY